MRTFPDFSPDWPLLATLHRAQGGERHAQEKLLATLHIPIRNYVSGHTGHMPDGGDLADDVAQETLIRIATRLQSCRATTDPQVLAWALAIARTRLIDYLRRVEPGIERLEFEVAEPDGARGRAPEPDGAALGSILRKVVRSLPPETRALLELRVDHGESWSDIASVLRTTAAGAKRRFQRAQARLRRELDAQADRLPVRQREAVHERLRRLK